MKKILGVFVLGAMLAVPAVASAADKLPDGFIAVADRPLDWANANAFCEQQGGKLPLINGSARVASGPGDRTVDGFGAVGAPWPADLHPRNYWTGTTQDSKFSWIARQREDKVFVSGASQTAPAHVICVPK